MLLRRVVTGRAPLTVRRCATATENIRKFLPAESFTGYREGFYFTNGEKGLGYYLDKREAPERIVQEPTKVWGREEGRQVVSSREYYTHPYSMVMMSIVALGLFTAMGGMGAAERIRSKLAGEEDTKKKRRL